MTNIIIRFTSHALAMCTVLSQNLLAGECGELIYKDFQQYKQIQVSREQVQVVFDKIYALREKGITFNPDKITECVEEGTCSAKSLDFVESYARAAPNWVELASLRAGRDQIICRQIAFNTIEVIEGLEDVDYAKNKMQSLANFQEYFIDYTSVMLDMFSSIFDEELYEVVEALPSGMYLVRMLLPCDNEKLEVKGHTTVYIKEGGNGFYYEPNKGLLALPPYHSSGLACEFKEILRKYDVHQVRFYRIKPKFTFP